MPSSRESARPRLSPPHRLPPSPPGSAPLAPSHRRPRVHRHHLLSPPPPLLLRRASPRDSHRVCLPHSHRPPPTPSCILQTSSRPHPSPPAPSQAPFTGSMAFKQMERLARRDCLREAARETHSPAGPLSPSQENIANFSTACESLGVPKFSLFQTVTLYENKARPTTPPPRTHPPPPPCTRPPLRPAPHPPGRRTAAARGPSSRHRRPGEAPPDRWRRTWALSCSPCKRSAPRRRRHAAAAVFRDWTPPPLPRLSRPRLTPHLSPPKGARLLGTGSRREAVRRQRAAARSDVASDTS